MALVKHSIMTVSCCPIKCFMIKQNVRERLFDYSLEGLFFLQFFADLWHDGPQAGVKYYYYVVACKNGTTYNWKPSDNKYDDDEYDVITSGCSTAATASVSNTTIGKTKIISGKSSKGKVNLKWQKVNGAAGYVVYRSTKKGSRYTKIAEITKGSTVKYTDKTAKKGKKYYYKVRAVKANEAGVDVFSAYSAAKAVKVK